MHVSNILARYTDRQEVLPPRERDGWRVKMHLEEHVSSSARENLLVLDMVGQEERFFSLLHKLKKN